MERPKTLDQLVPRVVRRPPSRPNASFRSVQVYSNHFAYSTKSELLFHMWDLKTEPALPADSRELILRVVQANERAICRELGPHVRSPECLYSLRKGGSTSLEFVEHPKFVLRLKSVSRSLKIEELADRFVNCLELSKLLNSLLKTHMRKLGFLAAGHRKHLFWDPRDNRQTGFTLKEMLLQGLHGYNLTVDYFVGGVPLFVVEPNSKLIRYHSLWQEYCYFRKQGLPHREVLDTHVLGRTFMAGYGNQRTYLVHGCDLDKTPLSPFPDDRFDNFAQYFKKSYGVHVTDPDQFLVYSIDRKRELGGPLGDQVVEVETKVYLIPELLRPVGLTEEMRSDRGLMQHVVKFARKSPAERIEAQRKIIDRINKSQTEEFGLQIEPNSNTLRAKVCSPPDIEFCGTIIKPNKGKFSIEARDNMQAYSLQNWNVVCFKEHVDQCLIFLNTMRKACPKIGVKISKPEIHKLDAPQTKTSAATVITGFLQKVALKSSLNDFLLFLPSNICDKVYNQVKKFSIEHGLRTSFFRSWQRSENLRVATEMVQKLINKRGDCLWRPRLAQQLGKEEHFMVAAADVFHQPGKDSMAVVVSTMNDAMMRTTAQHSLQKRRGDDVMVSMAAMLCRAFRCYIKANQHPPSTTLVIRDGVSDGMLDTVREKELKPLLAGLREEFEADAGCPEDPDPQLSKVKLIYLIMNKRINDRFFDLDRTEYVNPPGGMFVSEKITKDDRFDFYYNGSFAGSGLGATKPVYFNVLFNNTSLGEDQIHQLINHLSWCSPNFPGATRLPSVSMQVQKLGLQLGRLGCSDRPVKISPTLEGRAFYL